MPITGKLIADFESFHAAVNKAEIELKAMDSGAGKVSQSLNRMANSFSGSRMIQDATLMTKAVNDLGGASRLTEAEQRRVNATVTEAIAKYRALGMQAPADLQKLARETKQIQQETSTLTSGLGKMSGALGAIGIGLSVGAVVSFGQKVLETAGHINDLASQLGISTDAVQGFKYAAEQSGSSLDAVGTAITKMNQNLAGGDKATVQALKDAGLNFLAIRNMRPEDAFLSIADAIAKIPDPMKQADVAMQLFGRGGAELLPAIKNGFRETADAADKMSEDTIKALDEAGDAWQRLSDKVVIVSGEIIAHSMNMVEGALGSWRKFGVFVDNAIKMGIGPALALADSMEKAAKAAKSTTSAFVGPRQIITRTAEDIAKSAHAAEEAARKQREIFQLMYQQAKAGEEAWFKFKLSSVDAVNKMTEAIEKQGLPALADLAHTILLEPLPAIGAEISDFISKLPDATKLPASMMWAGIDLEAKKAKDSLGDFSRSLSDLAQISGGTFGGIVKEIANVIGAWHLATEAVEAYAKATTNAQKAAALAAGIAGVAQATGSGSTAGRVLGGALSGAAIGSAFGPIGTAIGAVGGALTGLFRGLAGLTEYEKRVREEAKQMEALKKQLIETHGGMEKLLSDAHRVGIAIENAFDWRDPAAFKKVIEDLDARTKKMLEGIATFASGARTRIDALAQLDPAKALAGGPDKLRAEFARLGLYAGTAFAQTLREQGIGAALEGAGPMFEQLDELKKKFPDLGLSLEGAAAKFSAFYEIAKANPEVMGALDGLTQMIKGAGDALFLDQELADAFGADLQTQYEKLIAGGANANQALILMQPSLQALWEAQQKFGLATDEATQALLDQAEEQGIVGENMRSVNEQMLDVLKEIAKVLGADIPEAADKAGKGVDKALKDKKYTIPVDFDINNPPVWGPYQNDWTWDIPPDAPKEPPAAAMGGLVGHGKILRFPFGAGGPVGTDTIPAWLTPGEIVLNAAQQRNVARNFRNAAAQQPIVIHNKIYLDGRQVAESVVPRIPGIVRRYGLA